MKLSEAHLTYCTNIHAGETWEEHFAALKQSFPRIKEKVSPEALMGIGLRLSNIASIDLAQEDNLKIFRDWLSETQSYVFTMNGFPYGGFHHTRVKDQVHAPDWTTRERLDYTIRLFHILAKLLPHGMDGGISTSPLSYKHWFRSKEELAKATDIATSHILLVAEELYRIWQQTGVILHLDIEPEPDGVLESGDEFIAWFENELLVKGRDRFKRKLDISSAEAEELIRRHICLCYDVCHFAVGYEPHAEIIEELERKEIKVGKIQISAALKASLPKPDTERLQVLNEFSKFNESTYLHQVVAKNMNGSLTRYPDLPQALEDGKNPDIAEWRAHFHVPVFEEDFGLLKSTQADIIRVLQLFNKKPFTRHLEVETYTWEVLSQALKLTLNESIIRELNWVKAIL